jgi:hypothetical protein
MAKLFITLTLLGSAGLVAVVGNNKWNKNVKDQSLAIACATSLTTLNSRLPKQKLVSYGEYHDYVSKRVSALQTQIKAKRISESEFRKQSVNLFGTYAPTSMKTCHAILEPSFNKCRDRASADYCAAEAEKAFSFGLRLVFDDAQALKQELDLSRVVAFDIRTAIQQTRPRLPASEKANLKNYATFLQ